ncbi:MAG: hypothetical protein Unbinned2514contig1001_28 [Prokaryotic dsDNA virus sp.]|nr:MAG: hypothetical protein Unbinned2514contig1001_28 [Prokaryotic dsDNA virus sp.]|tara:strand:- start:939 stop:1214 length:276 start_codon:yes stop_codon:yes gene_type:complete
MTDIHIKKDKKLKNIGGHKPFGKDIDPNNDLCLVNDKEKGQKAYYKGKPMKYLDYYAELADRGKNNSKGKAIGIGNFSGFGKGTLKKSYKE